MDNCKSNELDTLDNNSSNDLYTNLLSNVFFEILKNFK